MSLGGIERRRGLRRAGSAALWSILAACSQLPATESAVIPAIPAGAARVWFYRDAGPYDSQARPYLRMNDQVVAILEPRGAFYRDIPPGHYHVAVDQYGSDFNQTRDVNLGAGQQMYFKVVSNDNWIAGGDQDKGSGYSRPAFYVWQIPAETAQGDVARSPFLGGG